MTLASTHGSAGASAVSTVPAHDGQPSLDLKVSASPGFGQLLAQHRVSLLVSTYDAGKLIILRSSPNGLNVHFVGFGRTMGVAANANRLAVGTAHSIQELRNIPAVCPKLPQQAGNPQPFDACYVPRHTHVTGQIDVHEMAWGGEELWFINTLFSCLCTIDPDYSFAPRWRPPFIKGLSADDRCHLNGMAIVNDRPGYVTALAVSDEARGWRPKRIAGGLLMEVASSEIVAPGLSMPHSPRIYGNELLFLESGRGSLSRVDRRNGKVDMLAEFSGFTRGLDFCGSLAFVGLSRVRESNVFGGLALTERLTEAERFCGIQVVNLATGQHEGFLKFESGVNEIFAVQALSGIRYPAILEDGDPLVPSSYTLSPEALTQVRPSELTAEVPPTPPQFEQH